MHIVSQPMVDKISKDRVCCEASTIFFLKGSTVMTLKFEFLVLGENLYELGVKIGERYYASLRRGTFEEMVYLKELEEDTVMNGSVYDLSEWIDITDHVIEV